MIKRKSLILRSIFTTPGISRKEIAAAHGLHPNSVSDAVRELIDDEWIIEGETKTGGGGRAPIALYLNAEKRAALTVNYTQQELTCSLVNTNGKILRRVHLDRAPSRPEELISMITRASQPLLAGYSGHIIGIGVSDPGMVDSARGEIVRSSSFPGWRRVRLSKMLEAEMGLPVVLQDASRARAMAQYHSLPALDRLRDSMLYIDYNKGIGFALVTPEGIWLGQGFAGELGHVVIEPGGARCLSCGGSGCLESLANSAALEAHVRSMLEQGVASVMHGQECPTVEAICAAALEGDRLARSAVDMMMGHLGQAVMFMAAAFHPRYVVVGADSEATIRCIAEELTGILRDRIISEIAVSIDVAAGKETRNLSLSGIGLMVFEKAFQQ